MEWFPWYPALYRADTLDLTVEQDGAYRRLIDHYMETRLPLPNNEVALSRIVGMSINDFRTIAEQVLCKFNENDGELHNKRCDIELNRQDSLSRKRSQVAKAAHEKRNKTKGKGAIAKQTQSNSTDTGQDKTRQRREGAELDLKETPILKACTKIWNTVLGDSLHMINGKMSSGREKSLMARMDDTFKHDPENWREYLERIKRSDFLMGRTEKSGEHRNWSPNFNWVLKPSNCEKIQEGQFDNRGPETKPLTNAEQKMLNWIKNGRVGPAPSV